jgi:hypothetical protein
MKELTESQKQKISRVLIWATALILIWTTLVRPDIGMFAGTIAIALFIDFSLKLKRARRIVVIVLIIAVISMAHSERARLHPPRPLLRQKVCKDNQQVLKTQLEAYNLEYGFYPAEANWDTFLDEPHFWTPDSYSWVMKYCPTGTDYPYEYKSDTLFGNLPITNEHGTGYSKCKLRCIYDDSHKLETEDEKAN